MERFQLPMLPGPGNQDQAPKVNRRRNLYKDFKWKDFSFQDRGTRVRHQKSTEEEIYIRTLNGKISASRSGEPGSGTKSQQKKKFI